MPKYKPNNSILITDTSIDGVVTKIFRLKKCEHGENLPCIIFFHGGGFVFGKPQMGNIISFVTFKICLKNDKINKSVISGMRWKNNFFFI